MPPSDPAHGADRLDGWAGTEALALPLGATAALVGEYRWVEHALYVLLGGWVLDVGIPAVQVRLDGQSMRHAWHAELWAERLPVLAGVDGDRLTVPSASTAALLAALEGETPVVGDADAWGPDDGDGPPGALPRLAGLYRVVLPRLVSSYLMHRHLASPVTDAPVLRALQLTLNDELEDWRAGEQLLQRLITRPHDVSVVHRYCARLESLLVTAGTGAGLVAFPDRTPPV
jgi:hypothetical protein